MTKFLFMSFMMLGFAAHGDQWLDCPNDPAAVIKKHFPDASISFVGAWDKEDFAQLNQALAKVNRPACSACIADWELARHITFQKSDHFARSYKSKESLILMSPYGVGASGEEFFTLEILDGASLEALQAFLEQSLPEKVVRDPKMLEGFRRDMFSGNLVSRCGYLIDDTKDLFRRLRGKFQRR